MMCRMDFHLSGKVATLHLDNCMVLPFLSRLYCCTLNLANKQCITLIQACIHAHFNVKANYLSRGRLFQEEYLFPHIVKVVFQVWDQHKVDILVPSCTNQCQHYYIWEDPLPFKGLGLNTFNHSWIYQVC